MNSLVSTLNVISKGSQGLPFSVFKLSQSELSEIEHLVVQRFENFLYHDLSVVVYSLVQLDYSPKTLLNLVNRMNQVSNFNKE